MPPKQKITEENLLFHAFQIAKEQGIDAVTSRSVAKAVGCSIQPVFSHFPTMEELRQATFRYASNKLMQDILQYQNEPDFMARTNYWFLNLARNERNLFELLYLSDSYSNTNLWDVMMEWESNKKMVSAMADKYKISEKECKDIFLRGFFLLYGIATMIATNRMDISSEEAFDMMTRTTQEMVKGLNKEKGTIE